MRCSSAAFPSCFSAANTAECPDAPTPPTSHICPRDNTRTHHIRVVRVDPHVRERVEARHEPESHRPIELREWVVRVLAGLHRRERLRRRGRPARGRSARGALHHVDRVGCLDLVCRERIFIFQYTACLYRERMRLRLGNERGRGGGRVVCGEDPRWTVGAKEQRRTRVDESLPVRRYIRLLRNGLLEVRDALLRRNRDLELQLAWACICTWCAQSVGCQRWAHRRG